MKKMFLGCFILLFTLAFGIWAYLQLPLFGAIPTGERLARIQQSPNYKDGEFKNLTPTVTMTGDKSAFKATWDFLFNKDPNATPQTPVPAVKTNLNALPKDKDWYVWLGHSSYLLNLSGKTFLLDPVLVSATPLPFGGKPFAGADLYQPQDLPKVDYLIITHDHYDHLDYDTIRQIKDRFDYVITGLGTGAHLERWGVAPAKITELDWNDEALLANGFKITALPARHFSGRTFKANQTLWASFMLQTPEKTVYLGGDSGYDDFFKQIAERFPQIDLAIMENGQYNSDWANIHFLPEDLVKTVQILQPKQLLTVHNSKFSLSPHAWNEPLEKISQAAKEQGFPLLTPKIGEVVWLDGRPQQFEKWW